MRWEWLIVLVPFILKPSGGAPLSLVNFSASEFREWWAKMNPLLLAKLDSWATLLEINIDSNIHVMISPDSGALGRHLATSESQHNIDKWGMVNAADVMPYRKLSDGHSTSLTTGQLYEAYELAKQVGFTGIGVYKDWTPFKGFHLDVRAGRTANNPALWSGLRVDNEQVYRGVMEAFV